MILEGPYGAKVLVLKSQPSKPSYGPGKVFTGYEHKLIKQFLAQAKIPLTDYILGCIAEKRSPTGNFAHFFKEGDFSNPNVTMKEWIESFLDVLESYKFSMIICLGEDLLKFFQVEDTLEQVRGTILEINYRGKEIVIIPTYDYRRIITDPPQQFTVMMDFRKTKRISSNPELLNPSRTLIPSADYNQFMEYLEYLHKNAEEIVLDIENTPGPECHITQLGLAHEENYGMTFDIKDMSHYEETLLWEKFALLANNPTKKWIMQNGKHDFGIILKNQNIFFENFYFDTLIAAQLCWPELKKNLGFLSSLLLHVPAWKHNPGDQYYNVMDVVNTFGIYKVLKEELKSRGMWDFFLGKMQEVEIAILCELQGVRIDRKRMEELQIEVKEQSRLALEELNELTKEHGKFNFKSPKQMQVLLYEKLGLPVQYKRRKSVKDDKKSTTDAEALRKLANMTDSKVPKLIIEYKKKEKMISSFLELFPSETGKVHASWNVDSSSEDSNNSLGRWSSSASIILPFGTKTSKINLQNIPNFARQIYIPDYGKVIVGCDYQQAEGKVVAYLSNDIKMIEAFKNKDDIHKMKASEIMKKPVDDITKEERQIGKKVRHATNYDGTAPVLQAALNEIGIYTSIAECKHMILQSLIASPALVQWHKSIQDELKRTRQLTNPFGRNRIFMGEINMDVFKKGYAFKPQSGVGDLLNIAMRRFYKNYGDSYEIIFPLHDGFYVQCLPNDTQNCMRAMAESMKIPMTINNKTFTIDADFKVGPNWKDMEEVFLEEVA